ncbi:MAG TPA: hypothetical protein VIY86_06200, partial [Pirellulaceae bacterium]
MDVVQAVVRPVASLKLTVTLFGLSFFLVLVGTLAQYEKNMVQVMSDYFRTFLAWVEFRVFLPGSFFPSAPDVPGGFYFPGGKSIGMALMANLVAAHAVRFKVQAQGRRIWVGGVVMAMGLGLSLALILAAQGGNGVQGVPWMSYDLYWRVLQGLGIFAFSGLVFWSLVTPQIPARWRVVLCAAGAGLCFGLIAWGSGQRLGDSSMRILWLLGQSLVVASIVLGGSLIVFGKRGGIVTIHLGVALLMIGELLVSLSAIEEQIVLREGQSTNFAREQFALEIAVIDRSDPEYDQVVAVPLSRLHPRQTFADARLPFRLELVEFFPNSSLVKVTEPDSETRATTGSGRQFRVERVRAAGGAEANQSAEVASAYVRILLEGESDGEVYLLSQWLNDVEALVPHATDAYDSVVVGGKRFDIGLRAKRNYKSYTVHLIDVRKDDY